MIRIKGRININAEGKPELFMESGRLFQKSAGILYVKVDPADPQRKKELWRSLQEVSGDQDWRLYGAGQENIWIQRKQRRRYVEELISVCRIAGAGKMSVRQ